MNKKLHVEWSEGSYSDSAIKLLKEITMSDSFKEFYATQKPDSFNPMKEHLSKQFLVKKLVPEAILPTKSRDDDAGYDIYSAEEVNMNFGDVVKISTGIALHIPKGYYGRICDRSGLGSEGIHVFGGTVDHGYTGEVTVCLGNLKMGTSRTFAKGAKLAQIVLSPYLNAKIYETEELPESDRGAKGFGSSGV